MKVVIEVTEEEIAKGKRKNSRSCPIALAFKKVLKRGKTSVNVNGGGYVYIYGVVRPAFNTQPVVRVALTKRIDQFILNFDRGFKVEPTKLTLNLDEDKAKEVLNARTLKACKSQAIATKSGI